MKQKSNQNDFIVFYFFFLFLSKLSEQETFHIYAL